MKQKILIMAALAVVVLAWPRPHCAHAAGLRDAVAGGDFDTNLPAIDTDSGDIPEPEPAAVQTPGPGTVVLVHGYGPSWDEYLPLEEELRSRGYEVIRFTYDYKQSLETSADELVRKVLALRAGRRPGALSVVAHSMGGLVARRAMIAGRPLTLAGLDLPIELITVASPFGGFKSANAVFFMPFNGLGVTESFRYLGSARGFIRRPGALGANISHFKIQTDERGRTRLLDGKEVDDEIVRPGNQANKAVDSDPGLRSLRTLAAGHVQVLTDNGRVSVQLSGILDEYLPSRQAGREAVARLR